MSEIRFRNTVHRDFFLENMMKCKVNDCYHRAFFYVMGIAGETAESLRLSKGTGNATFRNDLIDAVFNFTENQLTEEIKIEVYRE